MLRLAFLLFLGALAAGAWLSWSYLGAWTLLVVPLGLYLLGRSLGGWLFRRLLMIPFRAKGRVLRDASATVHSLVRVAGPPAAEERFRPPGSAADGAVGRDAEDEEEDLAGRRLYELVATIEPKAPTDGPFQHWAPADLRLAPPDSDPAEDSADDGPCRVRRVEVEEDGAFVPDDGRKVAGPARVRLHVAVRPEAERLAFQYYFEKFGDVRLAG